MTHPTSTVADHPSTPTAGRLGRAVARLLAGYRSDMHDLEVRLAAARASVDALRSENESWRAGGLFRRACRAEVERDLALAAVERVRALAEKRAATSLVPLPEVLAALDVTE